MQYVLRHGQQFGNKNDGYNDYTKADSRKDKLDRKREEAKWKKSSTPSLKKGVSEKEVLDTWDKEFDSVQLSEDADLEEIFDKMTIFEDVLFDPNETETVKMAETENRVSLP